jgi:NADH-quinone oxidoreductase subunit N
MLIGVAVPGAMAEPNGAQAVLFYLAAYSIMTLGVFGVLVLLERHGRQCTHVDDLAGLVAAKPIAAILVTVFLLGLTGLPPTVGFWGKFNLFLAAWRYDSFGMRLLAVGLAVNAAIAAWYYLRIVKVACLDPPPARLAADAGLAGSPFLSGAMCLCAAATIGLFFFPGPLMALLHGLH